MNNRDGGGTSPASIGTGNRGGDGNSGEHTGDGTSESAIQDSTLQSVDIESTTQRDGTGISTDVCELSSGGGRPSSADGKSYSIFEKNGTDLEQQYTEGFQSRCARIFRECQRSDGWLLRDVLRFNNDQDYQTFLGILQKDRHYVRGFIQVCREATHCHIVHDCVFSNGTCRCSWWSKAKAIGLGYARDRCGHRRNRARTRTLSDVEKLHFYYFSKTRRIVFQKIRGQLERISGAGHSFQSSGLSGMPDSIREMEKETHRDGDQFRFIEPLFGDDEPDGETPRKYPQAKKRKMGQTEKLQLKIMDVLEKNPICPPSAIIQHKVWRQDEDLRFKDFSCKEVKSAIKCYTDNFTTFTMNEYQEMYNKEGVNPIFSAGYGDFSTYYYNIENSTAVMDKLIMYQCYEDEDIFNDFMSTLYNV